MPNTATENRVAHCRNSETQNDCNGGKRDRRLAFRIGSAVLRSSSTRRIVTCYPVRLPPPPPFFLFLFFCCGKTPKTKSVTGAYTKPFYGANAEILKKKEESKQKTRIASRVYACRPYLYPCVCVLNKRIKTARHELSNIDNLLERKMHGVSEIIILRGPS